MIKECIYKFSNMHVKANLLCILLLAAQSHTMDVEMPIEITNGFRFSSLTPYERSFLNLYDAGLIHSKFPFNAATGNDHLNNREDPFQRRKRDSISNDFLEPLFPLVPRRPFRASAQKGVVAPANRIYERFQPEDAIAVSNPRTLTDHHNFNVPIIETETHSANFDQTNIPVYQTETNTVSSTENLIITENIFPFHMGRSNLRGLVIPETLTEEIPLGNDSLKKYFTIEDIESEIKEVSNPVTEQLPSTTTPIYFDLDAFSTTTESDLLRGSTFVALDVTDKSLNSNVDLNVLPSNSLEDSRKDTSELSTKNIYRLQSSELVSNLNSDLNESVLRLASILNKGKVNELRKLINAKMDSEGITRVNKTKDMEIVTELPKVKEIAITEVSVSRNSSNKVVDLLDDIKSILEESNSKDKEYMFANLELKHSAQHQNTLHKVDSLQGNFDQFIENTNQKVNLVLENLSTLKLLVAGQEGRVENNDIQIIELNKLLTELREERQKFLEPLMNQNLDRIINAGKNEGYAKCNESIQELSNIVEKNDNRINTTFDKINNHIRKLDDSVSSFEGKIDRYFMRTTLQMRNSSALQQQQQRNKGTCNCNLDKVEKEMSALKLIVESQRMLIGVLESSILSLQDNVDSLGDRTSLVQRQQSGGDATTASPAFMQARLTSLEEELAGVKDLRNEVAYLRGILEKEGLPVGNRTQEDLCVWPYKRSTSDGCYFVSTEERLTWTAARTKCRDLQGDLATPRDFDAFRRFLVSQRLSRSYSFWMGANDQEVEDVWSWTDGRLVASQVWATGQPHRLRSDSCMELRPDLRLFAADEACRLPNYFICQQRRS